MPNRAHFFEDPHTDARMRRTIPRYARVGGAFVAVCAPIVTDVASRRLTILGLVAAALVSAEVVARKRIIDRLSHPLIYALLGFYCVLIASAIAATGDARSPYRLLYLLPTMFSAMFFTGPLRFGIPVLATAINVAIVSTFAVVDVPEEAIFLGAALIVAVFGAEVSDTLRRELSGNRALQWVLESSTRNPLGEELLSIGLEAALSVSGWDAGTVVVTDGDRWRATETRGMSAHVQAQYDQHPELFRGGLAEAVSKSGHVEVIPDVLDHFGRDHPIVAEGIFTTAGFPIRYHGSVVAVLILAHRERRSVDEEELARLARITEQLGLALGHAAAYRRETEVADSLRELNQRKDDFLANISHELRTPATAIRLVAATLRSSSNRLDEHQRDEMLSTLERRSEHLCELIGDLLDEAIAEAGRTRLSLAPIDWRTVLVRWAETAQLESGREITVQVPAENVRGTGDAIKLERAVTNLLSNAAKFSHADTPIVLALAADADSVTISVSDTGYGIPNSELPRIFERFYQVDSGTTRTAGGFGIGLSLVRHFVEAHGGTVSVESTAGKGSRFTIRIPRLVTADVSDAPVG